MKVVRLTGVRDMKESVVITITAGDSLKETTAAESKELTDTLVETLSLGMIARVADELNEHLLEVTTLMQNYSLLVNLAKSLGIEVEAEGGEE